jgi:hypothetical protein
MRLQNVHPFCLPSADYLMGELYALSPFMPIPIVKSVLGGVGDFQVATGGGFWVAVRDWGSASPDGNPFNAVLDMT